MGDFEAGHRLWLEERLRRWHREALVPWVLRLALMEGT